MEYKRVVKIIIDIAMYLIFVALMQEHLWGGLHEWLGITLFVLFITHNILNFGWYKSLFKGKYKAPRIVSAVINIALLAAMICCMVIPPLYRVGRLLALAIGLSNFELSGLCDSRKRPLGGSIEF